ncbi:hypothetical protein [Alkaliphilus serpentinus]|uniref:Uncharacterized protein n=1 Tax=Alkaliphilus serpentinus TaxID=1482731 RepID=A0A833M5T9_9FIRM|nr:hypothetical protein [Alkaliphilus serpentinus]KAB3524917.1 hypothetical protein F8153_15560 [Alkaliphilus serpentinus]
MDKDKRVIFEALNKEAQFTCEMLCAGVTEIRKANYARRGIYFQSFTSLSTGLERIGKLCIILDYSIRNSGDYPDNKYLKDNIRHDIEVIYQELIKIKKNYNFEFDYLQDLELEIYKDILNLLSRFAKGDRYSNIDILANNRSYIDPIKMWYKKVDLYFFNSLVSKKKKAKIKYNAKIINDLIGPFSLVRHTGEDEKDITSTEDASYRTGIFEAVGPYRQLYVFQIIRFFVEMLTCLQYKIIRDYNFDFPYFSEIFAIFYNDDAYVKRRKTWEMI